MHSDKRNFDLHSPHAQALRRAVSDAYAVLQDAQAVYERALAVIDNADHPSSDDVVALGRDYANAVIRYSDAVMAWLIFAETSGRTTHE